MIIVGIGSARGYGDDMFHFRCNTMDAVLGIGIIVVAAVVGNIIVIGNIGRNVVGFRVFVDIVVFVCNGLQIQCQGCSARSASRTMTSTAR